MSKSLFAICVGAAAFAAMCGNAAAQTVEATFLAAPDVYKVIFEDANFRVIEATRKAGVRDKTHSHPLPSVVYNLTDCTNSQVYDADGKAVPAPNNIVGKIGTANAIPVIKAHSAENTGKTDCKQLFVERK